MQRGSVLRDVFDRRTIFGTPLVQIMRWRCRQSRPEPGAERAQPVPLIVFLRSGNFRVHSSAEIGLLDCTRAGFFNAHVPFRSAHPYCEADSGSELAFHPDALADAFGGDGDPDRPFRFGWRPLSADAFLSNAVVLRRASAPDADELEIEELALRVLGRLAAPLAAESPAPGAATRVRERENAEALRGILSAQPSARHRLDALAGRFGATPFRLCRSFRASTGTTIHRYLTDVRLHRAIARLAEGCPDLSTLAFDLGFSSHSHFTAAFRRRLGTTPERVRAIAAGGGLPSLHRRLARPAPARN